MKNTLDCCIEKYENCDDVIRYDHHFEDNVSATLLYCKSVCNEISINVIVLPELFRLHELNAFRSIEDTVKASTVKMDIIKNWDVTHINPLLFSGKLIVGFDHLEDGFAMTISEIPQRKTEETNIEVAIRGPKDGLVESIETNLALVRKRIPINTVAYERFTIGTKTKTRVGLLYESEKINKNTVELVRGRMHEVKDQIEELISANQLEELISDKPYSLFPLTTYSGRPDFIVSCLLKGRFVIFIDGVPGAIIAPINLMMLLKTPEDTHFNYISSSFGRVLRMISLIIAIFLPSFFVALTSYHQDQIPFALLATVTMTRFGVPLPSPLEMLLVLLLLEMFKEAGYRLPSTIGQTLTVVGGLIIGDAAIRAGLTSPTMVVISAISIVAGSTLVSQTLSGTVSILRYLTLVFVSVLGMYGFMLSVLLITVYLTSLTSFGIPYLAPIAPIVPKDILRSVFKFPYKLKTSLPQYLNKKK